jgi:hypothetical protein
VAESTAPAADEVVAARAIPETAPETTESSVAAETSTPPESPDTEAAPANSGSTATQIVAEFVARVRSSFHMTATDASLGMSYEFKAKLLISSIVQSAPAEATPSPATLNYLQEQLGVSSAA